MSFRIWTIFWVFAVVAAAFATFGPGGILAVIIVVAFWALIFYGSKRLTDPIGLPAVLAIVASVLLAVLQAPRIASSQSDQCEDNLRQIAAALKAYSDRYGSFPPAYSVDPNDKPLLSWRVAILPLLEEEPLYRRFDLNKAWDDPVNRSASATPLEDSKCPAHYLSGPTTDYLAIVGPETAWPLAAPRSPDKSGKTPSPVIAVIEACGQKFNWAEPRDLTVDQAVELLASPLTQGDGHRVDNGFLYKLSNGRHVIFADGRVALLAQPIDRRLAKALVTPGGSEQIPARELAAITGPQLDWARCYALGSFLVISSLPAVRLVRRQSDQKRLQTAARLN